MFGYVRIYKPELKIKDYEIYKAAYCSVCRALGRHYGVIARGLLSYDATFLFLYGNASRQKDLLKKPLSLILSTNLKYDKITVTDATNSNALSCPHI